MHLAWFCNVICCLYYLYVLEGWCFEIGREGLLVTETRLWIRLKMAFLKKKTKQLLACRGCNNHFISYFEVNFVVLLFQHILADFQFVIKQFDCFVVWLSELLTCAASIAFVGTCRYWAFLEARLLACNGSVSSFISLPPVIRQWSTKNTLSVLHYNIHLKLTHMCWIYLNLQYVSGGKAFLVTTRKLNWVPGFSKTKTIRAVWYLTKHWG